MVNYKRIYTELHTASALVANESILINVTTGSSRECVMICYSSSLKAPQSGFPLTKTSIKLLKDNH